MTNSKTLFTDFMDSIVLQDSRDELESIAYLAFENVLGLTKTQILASKHVDDYAAQDRLKEIARRLNHNEPIQYVLGEAFFSVDHSSSIVLS